MHNGKLKTLQEVLDFYSLGVQHTSTLDPILNQNGRLGIPLSSDEKKKLIAFLKALTDEQFLSDRRFAEF
jgi:cytochrome c peroxidase